MRDHAHTPAIEDYVKAIWLIDERGEATTGNAIATQLGISQASVSAMIRKLDELGLVSHEAYRPVQLTDRGRLVALEVVRHHRLLELFLSETLGMSWDRIHAEAEVLEHHISEELEDLIAAKLGHPEFDPHGHPIPKRDGSVPVLTVSPVASLPIGAQGTLRQVRDETSAVLRFLEDRGVVVGARITVVDQSVHAGTTTLQVGDAPEQVTIGTELARHIDMELDD
ncbi:MAG: iron (metal) dependent repressor, DtxR family [Thermoleophilia bacterium]|nr:iron (metal) dependent repressor, DtxR family [Thermoleophilia bacterium]MCZ4496481.1 iron (metal) dependent repressor, DtxR family [Thermoleophilia bacterium]